MKNSFRALNKEALPLDRIVSMLKTALSKTWGVQRREFMIDVLRDAETLGTKEAPIPGEKELLLRKAEAHLGEGLAEAARRPVLSANMDAYAVGLRAVSADFSFTLPDLDAQLAAGDTSGATGWLKDNLQRHGARYAPREVITRATGAAPTEAPLMDYLETKFGALYGL